MVSRVRDTLRRQAPLRLLFEHPTIAALAAELDQAPVTAPSELPLRRRQGGGPCPLSFSQQRLWFLDQLEPDSTLYTIQDAIPWPGTLDVDRLSAALRAVVERHEILRTTFPAVDGVAMQVVGPVPPASLPVDDLSALDEDQRAAQVAAIGEHETSQPFDLGQRSAVPRALGEVGGTGTSSAGHHAPHHQRRLVAGSAPSRTGSPLCGPPPRPAPIIQYADFAVWQRQWMQGPELTRQLAYWKRQLDGVPAAIEFPLDKPRPQDESTLGARQLTPTDRSGGCWPQRTVQQLWSNSVHCRTRSLPGGARQIHWPD